MLIGEMFLSFFLYSFIGWLFESIVCSLVNEGHFINRGFLLGPYCPVYGCGVVICYLCLKDITNPIVLFFIAAILCCIIEYITAYAMEKIFHAKWWDYSNMKFNLHGRICLYGALLFGSANVVICRFIEPRLLSFFAGLPRISFLIVTVVIGSLMLADIITTIISWGNLNQHLKTIYNQAFEKSNNTMGEFSDYLVEKFPVKITDVKKGVRVQVENWSVKIKKGDLRFLHAFPNLQILPYEKLLKRIKIKEYITTVFGRQKK